MVRRTTLKDVKDLLEGSGIDVATWAPGEGDPTKYRFYYRAEGEPECDYFGCKGYGILTVLGARDAWLFAQGVKAMVRK